MNSGKNSQRESIERLLKLLGEIKASPEIFLGEEDLMNSLKTQCKLAKYSNANRGIRGVSLNTQKKLAEKTEGGYLYLNSVRLDALEAISRQTSAPPIEKSDSRETLRAKNRALQDQVERLKWDLEILSDILQKSMHQSKIYADEGGLLVRERCRKEQRELLALLGSRPRPRLQVAK